MTSHLAGMCPVFSWTTVFFSGIWQIADLDFIATYWPTHVCLSICVHFLCSYLDTYFCDRDFIWKGGENIHSSLDEDSLNLSIHIFNAPTSLTETRGH